MSTDRGPLRSYEVTWTSGHIETIQAHQVMLPVPPLFMSDMSSEPRRITFHGEFDGHWRLVLAAAESDIQTVRDVTTQESLS